MSDDDALQRLFRDGDVADEGFTRTVMLRVNHLRRRRRVVLGSAAAVGAAVAVPALWHAWPALVTALCVSTAALWVVTVSVEA